MSAYFDATKTSIYVNVVSVGWYVIAEREIVYRKEEARILKQTQCGNWEMPCGVSFFTPVPLPYRTQLTKEHT
jgi:hypothetical protein